MCGAKNCELQQTLAPDEQMWLNVGDAIHNQIPDADGKTIPPDVMFGSYELRDLGHPILGLLYEGKLIVDKTYGHASYGCTHCCGYSRAQLAQTPFSGPPNLDNQDEYQAYNVCDSRWDSFDFAFSPYSSNTGVATLPVSLMLHTVGVGGASTSAKNTIEYQVNVDACQQVDMPGTQGVTVASTILQSTPLWYFNGLSTPSGFTLGSTSATLTASGVTTGTFAWTVTNGTSKLQLENNSSTITKTNVNTVGVHSISYSTQINDVTLQLKYTASDGSQVTTSYNLGIDSPYKLLVGSITDGGISGTTCVNPPSGTNGFLSKINYTVVSFFGVQVSNIGVNENFADPVDDYIGNNWAPPVAQGVTTPNGAFYDGICEIYPGGTPPSLPPQNPLSSVKIDHASQTWWIGSTTPAIGVEVQSDILQRYQDHGRHLSIVSPVR